VVSRVSLPTIDAPCFVCGTTDADPLWVDNPAFRGLHSLRLTRVASAGVTPEGLGESKTRAGAMDGTGSWSTAG